MPLIVIEGLDGSGKDTQAKRLEDELVSRGEICRRINFPNYDSSSSSLVKMYLAGELGSDPMEVNAYAAATFYAVDRFAGYTKDWQANFNKGETVIANRYTTSNIVFQMTKLPKEKWDEFISWAEDMEYSKMLLPRPDIVIYLDLPIKVSQKLMSGRYNGDEGKKDIHERNISFLELCRETAHYAAQKCGWKIIDCSIDGEIKSISQITKDILKLVVE